MPFKSEAQRRFLWAKHPKVARKWANEEKHMPNPIPGIKPGKRDKMFPKGGNAFGPQDKAAFQYSRPKKRRKPAGSVPKIREGLGPERPQRPPRSIPKY